MSNRPSALDTAKIGLVALRLAARLGWAQVTLDAVARQAKISTTALREAFRSPASLAPAIAAFIDREAFAAAGKSVATPHDALFDLLMARFDVLQQHRAAILSMAEAARHDRGLSCALARATLEGSYRLIDAAALTQPPRPVLAAGLSAVYGWAFFVWRQDESRDMGKTMAALDRGLRWSEKALAFFSPKG
jgi:AcrR family transcriptional regulator